MSKRSLSEIIRKQSCTENEAKELVYFLLKGTHTGSQTQRGLDRRRWPSRINSLEDCGIFGRVMLITDEQGNVTVDYCAGQSYPDEVRCVRELIAR